MNKLCNVVMLPTEKASFPSNTIMKYGYSFGEENAKLCYESSMIRTIHEYQHLYITSDEEIKEGDWMLCEPLELAKGLVKAVKDESSDLFKKVIATTDPDLELPQIPESFIKAYCKVGGIDEVQVEYTKVPADRAPDGWSISLKLREDNTIIIHQAKNYTREQVIDLIDNLLMTYPEMLGTHIWSIKGNWVKENL